MRNPYQPDSAIGRPERQVVLAYMATAGAVLLLMMLLGLVMRLAQGELMPLAPDWFYRVMTLHGTGMVGIAGLAGAGVMWYFLRQHADLSLAVAWTNLGLFLTGVVLIIAGIAIGGYGGAWTFLYPLPAEPMGMWATWGAASFLVGLLLVGVGFLLLHLDTARAIMARYGGLGRALGWPQLFGPNDGNAPAAAVVASTMVLIVNILGLVSGAAIVVMSLVNLYFPAFEVDPLLAKNMIYFFGHVFINATIYMAVIGVYHLLPRYTGRPWPSSNKAFLAAWTASTVMVVIVYPHHMLMDFAQPEWLHILGQIISYTSGLPVLVVTAYGAIVNLHRSNIRWDLASGLLTLGTFGWAAGIVPAMVDATIVVNQVMHNTLWVPGHFHFYLLLGMIAMALGFMSWMVKTYGGNRDTGTDRAAFWLYALGGLGFVGMFLVAGREGTPRRFAEHLAAWVPYDRIASLFAALVILATLVFMVRFFAGLKRAATAETAA
ncbi:MAG: cbb3-type cytochrome c oxidase subunit I [Thiohalorhabdaceae bacterium]